MKKMAIKSYSELITLPTLEERFRYLQTDSRIGEDTFGSLRFLNQKLYTSVQWIRFKDSIVMRDHGMELALDGYPISGIVVVHHINPLTPDDIINHKDCVFDPDNVICLSSFLHKQLHYGDYSNVFSKYELTERKPNDTCPWRL